MFQGAFLLLIIYGISFFHKCYSFVPKVYNSNIIMNSKYRSKIFKMHGSHGHSHSHHEHLHVNDDNLNNKIVFRSQGLSTWGKTTVIAGRPLFRSLLVGGIVILLPALMKTKRLGKQELGIFTIVSSVLGLLDIGRLESKKLLQKIRNFQNSLVKHTTPLTRKYFFKNENAADRVTLLGISINILLSIGKFWAGIACHSSVLIADAGHSLSDLLSDFVTLWAVQIARLPPDDDHPYGHGKFEAVGSLFLALTLLGTGFTIGRSSYAMLIKVIAFQRFGSEASGIHVQIPTFPALAAAALSIWSKEWLFRVTRRVGTALNSQVIIANAWHHRSDAFSSILALISIALAMTLPSCLCLDSGAGLLVAGMICTTGFEILIESVQQLTDSNDSELEKRLEIAVRKDEEQDKDIVSIKKIRTRTVGSSALVDVEIETPNDMSASATRAVEERLRWRIIEMDPMVMDATVHSTTDETVCPLLLVKSNDQQSVAEIESQTQNLLQDHNQVNNVTTVQVHYFDTIRTRINAVIKLDPSITIATATTIADELKTTLLNASDLSIDEANIYIDANRNVDSIAI